MVVALTCLGASSTAQADAINEEGLSPAEVFQLKAFFQANNVGEEAISSLEKKMQEGGIPDSLKPEEYPVASRVHETNGRRVIIDQFVGGPIVRTEAPSVHENGFFSGIQNSLAPEHLERVDQGDTARPLGVSGCRTTSSSRYRVAMTECRVSTSWGFEVYHSSLMLRRIMVGREQLIGITEVNVLVLGF
ncbi:hypothetical protein [uncultured Tessaracoccus sp.]|uniref:hypothetical protein n=1 Tax=uncultured Tessaracoccus sp. TaxID=905023 RepID=UPI00263648CB|nr:hypothetical protein [uncultured Tessaracoccus sp.]